MFDFMKKKDASATPEIKTKKSKGFYLELDEATGIAPAPKTATPAVPAVVTPEAVVSPEITPSEVITTTPVETTKTEATKIAKNSKPIAPPQASQKAPEPVAVATAIPEPEIIPAYLQMNNTPRRRPGANMAMFKDMAQQVKTSKD